MGRWGAWDFDTTESIGAVANILTKEEQHFIADTFDRHITEFHAADFEVCKNQDCQRAVELENSTTLFTVRQE
jgi:hypothetical protein